MSVRLFTCFIYETSQRISVKSDTYEFQFVPYLSNMKLFF